MDKMITSNESKTLLFTSVRVKNIFQIFGAYLQTILHVRRHLQTHSTTLNVPFLEKCKLVCLNLICSHVYNRVVDIVVVNHCAASLCLCVQCQRFFNHFWTFQFSCCALIQVALSHCRVLLSPDSLQVWHWNALICQECCWRAS